MHSNEVKALPDAFEKLVNVPHVVGRDGDDIRNLEENVELFDRDLIDLVENIDGRDVNAKIIR